MTAWLLGFVLGPALQLQQAALWEGWVYAALTGACLGIYPLSRLRERVGVRAMAAFTCVAIFSFALCGLRSAHFISQSLPASVEGRDITITGVIAAMPQRSDSGMRFRFEVESALLEGQSAALPPQIYLGWYGNESQPSLPELRAGDRWRMSVRLKAPHGNINPHGFDYELWLWEQGLQATGYVRAGAKDSPSLLIESTWRHPVERARQIVRDAVFAHIEDRKAAGVLAALIVGDQNAIERADWDIFRATGVAHLMSISGLHITMFAWGASLVVGWLWRRSARLCLAWPAQHAALAGGIVLATCYALFSGWGVPAQRTIWMLATVGLLRLSGRQWPWPQVWLLACAVVVTIDPWALLQAGFWLSFVAVGVLFATDIGQAPTDSPEPSTKRERVMRHVLAGLREQWVITLALAPLTLLLFGQVSLVGLLANAIAIPWVTLVVTPLAMLGVVAGPLWHAAAWAVNALSACLGWLAALPFATIGVPAPPLWAGIAGVAGGVLIAMHLPWSVRALGVPLILPVVLWQVARPSPGHFEVLAADVGQGNALIVRTAAHTLVYDSGPRYGPESDAGHRVLVPLLRALDEKIDTLMLSHRDIDHTGGAAAVLTMQPQAALSSSIEETHELQQLRKSTRCMAGQHWQWDGVDFHVMHPQPADYDAPAKPNALSCVLRISNGAQAALLVGDIEQPQEARLVESPLSKAELKADVLLVPHHGSKTSSSEPFLDAVHPTLALVQAGYRNRFGHPAPPVMDRYRERGIRVFDSAHCGAAQWSSARPTEMRCERDQSLRYWSHRVP